MRVSWESPSLLPPGKEGLRRIAKLYASKAAGTEGTAQASHPLILVQCGLRRARGSAPSKTKKDRPAAQSGARSRCETGGPRRVRTVESGQTRGRARRVESAPWTRTRSAVPLQKPGRIRAKPCNRRLVGTELFLAPHSRQRKSARGQCETRSFLSLVPPDRRAAGFGTQPVLSCPSFPPTEERPGPVRNLFFLRPSFPEGKRGWGEWANFTIQNLFPLARASGRGGRG
jgi:hypothetical protein